MKITKARLREIILEELQGETGIQENDSDEIFAPNHYCIHHGGVEHNGTIQMAEAVQHVVPDKNGYISHYDMRLIKSGIILEDVAAEDIQVTEASLAYNDLTEKPHNRDDHDDMKKKKKKPPASAPAPEDKDARRAKELRDKRRAKRRPGTDQPLEEEETEKTKAEQEAEEAARLRKKRRAARRDQPSYRKGLEEDASLEELKALIARELKNLL